MEVDLTEVISPAEEEGEEDVNMRDDDRRDESDGEEQASMEDDEQCDGAVPEQEAHSKQNIERVKKALKKLHTNLGHPGVKEMVRVLQHGRASELAGQEVRRMHCDICAAHVQPKLPRPAIPCQVLDFNKGIGSHWEGVAKSVKCFNIVCHGTLFQMIAPLSSISRRLAAMGT